MAVLSRPAGATTTVTTVTNPDGTQNTTTHHTAARPGGATAVTSIVLRNSIWDTQKRRASAGSGSTLFGPLIVNHIGNP
jgi:hypothetical protein